MNFPAQDTGFYRPKTRDVPGAGIGGRDSGDDQVRGLIGRRKNKRSPFQKLRALAQVCTERLNSLDTRNAHHQRQYRKTKKASVDRMEDVKALNRRRYYERIARLKATGECEAFKKHKVTVGKQRYHNLSKERRAEVCRKNLLCQRARKGKMVQEGTFEEYRRRLNARRREKKRAEKKRAMGTEGWKELQRTRYAARVKSDRRRRLKGLDDQLARPFPLQSLPLEWAEQGGGNGHCSNHSCERVRVHGPILVMKRK